MRLNSCRTVQAWLQLCGCSHALLFRILSGGSPQLNCVVQTSFAYIANYNAILSKSPSTRKPTKHALFKARACGLAALICKSTPNFFLSCLCSYFHTAWPCFIFVFPPLSLNAGSIHGGTSWTPKGNTTPTSGRGISPTTTLEKTVMSKLLR